ncbi:MAG: type III-A CRISPR-associated protein Cas10/Csm1 [Candidatus Viridilinea halotolerans]|uniref:CRISPR system single-strand-specific deoxyribonuclease Cas10/Csm1 (subtype III-A) n=1 Tax=Candidatus Viridilinea halotolerans TaxID=2491704 RepID=A0A426TWB7_9CHLR|nr:MAG: type III-A CRISPR-associated protein Cas10/Csm1 [Candidatus Viridilinea halotolerans]
MDHAERLALAALRYWATRVTQQAWEPPEDAAAAAHLWRTAWLAAGGSAPADSAWPPLLAGPLASVFSLLQGEGAPSPSVVVQPQALLLQREVLFPQAAGKVVERAAVVAELAQALDDLDRRGLPLAAQVEGVLFALQRYAWALPSPLAGVALYDFARTHAALAAALSDDEVCLVGGDLSGVQDFIYSVSARGATKQLRGRSLYLQLLTDACAHAVLAAAEMPLSNLLYAGGGRFYVVVPGAFAAELPALRKRLGDLLFKAHYGELYLALGGASFAPEGYNVAVWNELSEQLEQDKRRRFAALDRDAFKKLFDPKQPPPPRPEAEGEEEEPLDAMAESLQKLGELLQRASVLSVQPGKGHTLHEGERTFYDVLNALGLASRLLVDEQEYRPSHGVRRRLLKLADESEVTGMGPHDLLGLRYTAAEAPRATAKDVGQYEKLERTRKDDQELREGHVKPFGLLAAQSRGVKRLGVLRMDVDDLGKLFGNKEGGIKRPDGIAGLVVTAALSGALARFFEGWVGELCRRANERGDGGVIAVYSGGDDLFLVGSWHLMPGLARQIREDFAAYVLGHEVASSEAPPITLSAGIVLINAGYPLYQAASDAAEALDAAKAHDRPTGRAKNALTFLGRTLGWEQVGETVALCEQLGALVGSGAPRALLMSIQRIDANAQQTRRHTRTGEVQFSYGPWVWQGAYQLTRMAERAQGKESKEAIQGLRERLVGSEGVAQRTIERAGLAARWAQLLLRERGGDEG